MKITRRKDDTYTIVGVPRELLSALSHITGDLGDGNCVLRYDKKLYDPWARPNKATRKALREFAKATGATGSPIGLSEWWFDQFDVTDKPKFARRKDQR